MNTLEHIAQHKTIKALLQADLKRVVGNHGSKEDVMDIMMAIAVIDNTLVELYEEIERQEAA